MTLGTIQGVTDICKNTDVALITRMLIKARGDVDKALTAQGISAPVSDTTLDTAAEARAAMLIAHGPGAIDPRTGYGVDGFSRKDGNSSQIAEFKTLFADSVAEYVATQLSASPLPSIGIVGRVGTRIGEYEAMDEDEEDVY